jgi:mannose/fructose-specific phosphotransferase system component IIA
MILTTDLPAPNYKQSLPLAAQAFNQAEDTPDLIQTDLYFGLEIGTDVCKRVTESQFQQFLQETITPLFADGLTVYDAKFLDSESAREPSKVVSLSYRDDDANRAAIAKIIRDYGEQFQQPVSQVMNRDIAVGFGQGEDVIANDPTPELIQVDLYLGRNIGTTGQVSDQAFQQFLSDVVTPSFPNGLTVYEAKGQFLDSSKTLIREPSNVVTLIFEDTESNEQSIDRIIDAYQDQFQQESVLEIANEAIKIGFGEGEDLIDNSSTPELIQVDLYFGRNIGTTGQVSEQQFQQFLNTEVIPRFPTSSPNDLTLYNADGQFLDSADRLIQEPSQVLSLVVTDSQQNEQSINQIISAYKSQFQQESVLQVVDETIDAANRF